MKLEDRDFEVNNNIRYTLTDNKYVIRILRNETTFGFEYLVSINGIWVANFANLRQLNSYVNNHNKQFEDFKKTCIKNIREM